MILIKSINATEILDSRGHPTVETTVILSDGTVSVASVPSGASVSKFEAVELRDKDLQRFHGQGVLNAVKNVNEEISTKLVGMDVVQQGKIDQTMIALDGTPNKARLGANAILSVSLAVARAASMTLKLPLYAYIAELLNGTLPEKIAHMPTPTFNVINGGKHGAGNLDLQEYHVVPATIKPYHEALVIGEEIYQKLKEVLMSRNATYSVGDEGGYAPNLYTNLDAFEAIMEAIRATKHRFGFDVFLGADVAASHFKVGNTYHIKDNPVAMNTEEFVSYMMGLHRQYHLLLLEDPLDENDWDGWIKLTANLGKEVIIVGDDLLSTNPHLLQKAIDQKAANGILVKPNQIGTISETLQVVKMAKKAGFKINTSHRSGETNDTFIADFAVGIRSEYVKFGAPARGERVAKYNRLLEIERELKLV